MAHEVAAIYEKGVLRLLAPVPLPDHTRVRVQILTEAESRDQLRRARAALAAAGLVRQADRGEARAVHVSQARRQELRRLYAMGGPLSEEIIRERDAR